MELKKDVSGEHGEGERRSRTPEKEIDFFSVKSALGSSFSQ
jgi:hypothetical protein